MLRSMYAGISGLGSVAMELDVIGNNIANSGTVGYKTSRVTFSEMLAQTVAPASRPVSGGRGGTNPQQIGLGTSVGSVDQQFTQGFLESTGVVTDLALQGDGFFVLNDGTQSFFTRAGAFGLDGDNTLVDRASGLHLQGLMADDNGIITPGPFEDLYIDPSATMPASASTQVQLFGNLDSDSDATQTIMESSHFMAASTAGDDLRGLYAQDGDAMGLVDGTIISLTGMIDTAGGAYTIAQTPFVVGSTVPGEGGTTMTEMIDWAVAQLESQPDIAAGDVSITLEADGSLSIVNNSGGADLMNLQFSVTGNTDFNQTFRFDSSVAAGGGAGSTIDAGAGTGMARSAAEATDLITEIFNSKGQSLGLNISVASPQTTLLLGGTVGDSTAPGYSLVVDNTTTMDRLLTGLQITLGVSSDPISLDSEGRILIDGEVGTDNEIHQIRLTEVGEVNPTLSASFDFNEIQEASDATSFQVSSIIYDSLGNTHNTLFTFTKEIGQNAWTWVAEMEGDEVIVEGGNGTASFADTGEIVAFEYADNSGGLRFQTEADGEIGAEDVTVQIDAGQLGDFNGLTQYASTGNIRSLADGYGVGALLDFEINTEGMVVGRFTNDTVRTLAHIGVASFANNNGLLRGDGNTYMTSSNSGDAMTMMAGAAAGVTIHSGSLEGSNVDLTQELTNLVIAQRAFQANSRIITTGDSIMQELVNMLR